MFLFCCEPMIAILEDLFRWRFWTKIASEANTEHFISNIFLGRGVPVHPSTCCVRMHAQLLIPHSEVYSYATGFITQLAAIRTFEMFSCKVSIGGLFSRSTL